MVNRPAMREGVDMSRVPTGYDEVGTLILPLDNFSQDFREHLENLNLELTRQNRSFCHPLQPIPFDLQHIKGEVDYAKVKAFLTPAESEEFVRLWKVSKDLNNKMREIELQFGGEKSMATQTSKVVAFYWKYVHQFKMNRERLQTLVSTASFRRDASISEQILPEEKTQRSVLVRLANYYFDHYMAGLEASKQELIQSGADANSARFIEITNKINKFKEHQAQYAVNMKIWSADVDKPINDVNAVAWGSVPGQSCETQRGQRLELDEAAQAQRKELLGNSSVLTFLNNRNFFEPIKSQVETAFKAMYSAELSSATAARQVPQQVSAAQIEEVAADVDSAQFIGYSDDELESTYNSILEMIEISETLLKKPSKLAQTKFFGLFTSEFGESDLDAIKANTSFFLKQLRRRQVSMLWEMQARMAVAVNPVSASLSFQSQKGLLYNSDTAARRARQGLYIATQKATITHFDCDGKPKPIVKESCREIMKWRYDITAKPNLESGIADYGSYSVHIRKGLSANQFKSYQDWIASFVKEQEKKDADQKKEKEKQEKKRKKAQNRKEFKNKVAAVTQDVTNSEDQSQLPLNESDRLSKYLRAHANKFSQKAQDLLSSQGVSYYMGLLFGDAFDKIFRASGGSALNQDLYGDPAVQSLISIPSLRILLLQLVSYQESKIPDIIQAQGVDGLVFKKVDGDQHDIFSLLLEQVRQDYREWKKKHDSFFSRSVHVQQLIHLFDRLLVSKSANDRAQSIGGKVNQLRKAVIEELQEKITDDLHILWSAYRSDVPEKPSYEHNLDNYLHFVRLQKAMKDVGCVPNPTGFFADLFKILSKPSSLEVSELVRLRDFIKMLVKAYSSDYFIEIGLLDGEYKHFLKQCDVMLEVLNVCELKVSDKHVTSLLDELNEAFPDNQANNKNFLATLGTTYLQSHFLDVDAKGDLTFRDSILGEKPISPNVCLYLLTYSEEEHKERMRTLLGFAQREAQATGRESFVGKYAAHLDVAEVCSGFEEFIANEQSHTEEYSVSGVKQVGSCVNGSHLLTSINTTRLYQIFGEAHSRYSGYRSWEKLSGNCYVHIQNLLSRYVAKFQIAARDAEASFNVNAAAGQAKLFADCLPQRHTMLVNLLAASSAADDYAFSLFKYFLNCGYFFENVSNHLYYNEGKSTEHVDLDNEIFKTHVGYTPKVADQYGDISDSLFIEYRLQRANASSSSINGQNLQKRIDQLLCDKINVSLILGEPAVLNLDLVKVVCRYGSVDVISHMHCRFIHSLFERIDCSADRKRSMIEKYNKVILQLKDSGRIHEHDYNIHVQVAGYTTLLSLLGSKLRVTEEAGFTEENAAIDDFYNFYLSSNEPLFELLGNKSDLDKKSDLDNKSDLDDSSYSGDNNPFLKYKQAASYVSDRYYLQQGKAPERFSRHMLDYLNKDETAKNNYAEAYYGAEYARRMALYLYYGYLSDDGVLIDSKVQQPILAHFFKPIEDGSGHEAIEKKAASALCSKYYREKLLSQSVNGFDKESSIHGPVDVSGSRNQLSKVWLKACDNFDEKSEMHVTVDQALCAFTREKSKKELGLEIEKLRKIKQGIFIQGPTGRCESSTSVMTQEQAQRKLLMLEHQFLAKIRQYYHAALTTDFEDFEDFAGKRELILYFIEIRTSEGQIIEGSATTNFRLDDFSDHDVKAELKAMADENALSRKKAAVEQFSCFPDDFGGDGRDKDLAQLSLVEERKNKLNISIQSQNAIPADARAARAPSVAPTHRTVTPACSYDISNSIGGLEWFFAGIASNFSAPIDVNADASTSADVIYDNVIFSHLNIESAKMLHDLYLSADHDTAVFAMRLASKLDALCKKVKCLLTVSQCKTHPYVIALEAFLRIVYCGVSDSDESFLVAFAKFYHNARFLLRQLARGSTLAESVAIQLALEPNCSVTYLFDDVLNVRRQHQRQRSCISFTATRFLVPVLSDLASRAVKFDLDAVNQQIFSSAQDAGCYKSELTSKREFFTSINKMLSNLEKNSLQLISSDEALKNYIKAILSAETGIASGIKARLESLINVENEYFVLPPDLFSQFAKLLSGQSKLEFPIHISAALKELLERQFALFEDFLKDDSIGRCAIYQFNTLQSFAQLLELINCHTDFDCDFIDLFKVKISSLAKQVLIKQCSFDENCSVLFNNSKVNNKVNFAACWLNVFGSVQDKVNLQLNRKHLEQFYIKQRVPEVGEVAQRIDFQAIANAVNALVEGTSAEERLRVEKDGDRPQTDHKSRTSWLQELWRQDVPNWESEIKKQVLALHSSPSHYDYINLLNDINKFFVMNHADIHLVVDVMIQNGIDCIADIPFSCVNGKNFFDYMSDLGVKTHDLTSLLNKEGDHINLCVAAGNAIHELSSFSSHDAAFTYEYASKTTIAESRFKWARTLRYQLEKNEKYSRFLGLLDRAMHAESSLFENVVINDSSLPHHYLNLSRRCLADLSDKRPDLLVLAERFSREMVIDPCAIKSSTLDALIKNFLDLMHRDNSISESLYSRLVHADGSCAESFDILKSMIILDNQRIYVEKFQVIREQLNDAGLLQLVKLLSENGFRSIEELFSRGFKPTDWFVWYSAKGKIFRRDYPGFTASLQRLYRDRSGLRNQVNFLLQKQGDVDFLEIGNLPCDNIVSGDSSLLAKTLLRDGLKTEVVETLTKNRNDYEHRREVEYQKSKLLHANDSDVHCTRSYRRLLQYIAHKEFFAASALVKLMINLYTEQQLRVGIDVFELKSVVQYATLSHKNGITVETLRAFNDSQLAGNLSQLCNIVTIKAGTVEGNSLIVEQENALSDIVSSLERIKSINDKQLRQQAFTAEGLENSIKEFFSNFCNLARQEESWFHYFGLTEGIWQKMQQVASMQQYDYDAVVDEGDYLDRLGLSVLLRALDERSMQLKNVSAFFRNIDGDVGSTRDLMISQDVPDSPLVTLMQCYDEGNSYNFVELLRSEKFENIMRVLTKVIRLLPTEKGAQLRKQLFSELLDQNAFMLFVRAIVINRTLTKQKKINLVREIITVCNDVSRKFSTFEKSLSSDFGETIVDNIAKILRHYVAESTQTLSDLDASSVADFFDLCFEMMQQIEGDRDEEKAFSAVTELDHFNVKSAFLYQSVMSALSKFKTAVRGQFNSALRGLFDAFSANASHIEFTRKNMWVEKETRLIMKNTTASTGGGTLDELLSCLNSKEATRIQLVLRVYHAIKLFEGRLDSLNVGRDDTKQEREIREFLKVEFTKLRTHIFALASYVDKGQSDLASYIDPLKRALSLEYYFELWKFAQETGCCDLAAASDAELEGDVSSASFSSGSREGRDSSTSPSPSVNPLQSVPMGQLIRQNLLSFLQQCLRLGKFELAAEEFKQCSFLLREGSGFKFTIEEAQAILDAASQGACNPRSTNVAWDVLLENNVLGYYLSSMLQNVMGHQVFDVSQRNDFIRNVYAEIRSYNDCMTAVHRQVLRPVNLILARYAIIFGNDENVRDCIDEARRAMMDHLPKIKEVIDDLTAQAIAVTHSDNLAGEHDESRQSLLDSLYGLISDLRRLYMDIHPVSSHFCGMPVNVDTAQQLSAFDTFKKAVNERMASIKGCYDLVKEHGEKNVRSMFSARQRLAMSFNSLRNVAKEQRDFISIYNEQLCETASLFIRAFDSGSKKSFRNLDELVQHALTLLTKLNHLNVQNPRQGSKLFLQAVVAKELRDKFFEFVCYQSEGNHYNVAYLLALNADEDQLILLKEIMMDGCEKSPFGAGCIDRPSVSGNSRGIHSALLRELHSQALSLDRNSFYLDYEEKKRREEQIRSIVTLSSVVREADDLLGKQEDIKLHKEAAVALELKYFIKTLVDKFLNYFRNSGGARGRLSDVPIMKLFHNMSPQDFYSYLTDEALPREIMEVQNHPGKKDEHLRIQKRFLLLRALVLNVLDTQNDDAFGKVLDAIRKLKVEMDTVANNVSSTQFINTPNSSFLRLVNEAIAALEPRKLVGAQGYHFHTEILALLTELLGHTNQLIEQYDQRVQENSRNKDARAGEIAQLEELSADLAHRENDIANNVIKVIEINKWIDSSARRDHLTKLQNLISVLEKRTGGQGNIEINLTNDQKIMELFNWYKVLSSLGACSVEEWHIIDADFSQFSVLVEELRESAQLFSEQNQDGLNYIEGGEEEEGAPLPVLGFSTDQYQDYKRKKALSTVSHHLIELAQQYYGEQEDLGVKERLLLVSSIEAQLRLVNIVFSHYAAPALLKFTMRDAGEHGIEDVSTAVMTDYKAKRQQRVINGLHEIGVLQPDEDAMLDQVGSLCDRILLLGYISEHDSLLPVGQIRCQNECSVKQALDQAESESSAALEDVIQFNMVESGRLVRGLSTFCEQPNPLPMQENVDGGRRQQPLLGQGGVAALFQQQPAAAPVAPAGEQGPGVHLG